MKFLDLTGSIIRNFKILSRAPNSLNGRTRWVCLCVCGRKVIMGGSISSFKRKRSCGCKRNLVHGHSNRSRRGSSPEYQSWRAMRSRCSNPKDKSFNQYGGRGISFCPRWDSFVLFLEDMGSRPIGTTLDRIDHSGNYELKNCRWSDSSTQAKNRRPRKAIESFSDYEIRREYDRRFNREAPQVFPHSRGTSQ
jgi:hypothetical protein